MNLKNGKVFTSKFAGTGPSYYEKRIYRAAVSQRLRYTALINRLQSDLFRNLPAFLKIEIIKHSKPVEVLSFSVS